MADNLRFINDITRMFYSTEMGGESSVANHLYLENNNVYSKYMVIDCSNLDDIEIPVFATNHIQDSISDIIVNKKELDKLIIPLYDNSLALCNRTFDSIIRNFFINVSYASKLQSVVTSKGDLYYGGKGLILDSSYTPLLMCTLKARKEIDKKNNTLMKYYRAVCHIHPKVFLEDNMINKGIIKKIIPIYANRNIMFPTAQGVFSSVDTEENSRKVQIIIDKFDNFFYSPVKPTPSTCSDDILNQCLVDNLEEIVDFIK